MGCGYGDCFFILDHNHYCINFSCFLCWTCDWQTGKSSFVEHRTFLHLYRSFHRLWIFLALMFQVSFFIHQFTLKYELLLVMNYSIKHVYAPHRLWQLLLSTMDISTWILLKQYLASGHHLQSWISSRVRCLCLLLFLLDSIASNSQNTIFVMNRLLGCVAHIWVIQNCKGHGCVKASNKIFLGWLDFSVCNICLPVSFWFSLGYFVG
jgi:hypothetical protein